MGIRAKKGGGATIGACRIGGGRGDCESSVVLLARRGGGGPSVPACNPGCGEGVGAASPVRGLSGGLREGVVGIVLGVTCVGPGGMRAFAGRRGEEGSLDEEPCAKGGGASTGACGRRGGREVTVSHTSALGKKRRDCIFRRSGSPGKGSWEERPSERGVLFPGGGIPRKGHPSEGASLGRGRVGGYSEGTARQEGVGWRADDGEACLGRCVGTQLGAGRGDDGGDRRTTVEGLGCVAPSCRLGLVLPLPLAARRGRRWEGRVAEGARAPFWALED